MPKTGENIYKRKDGRWEGRFISGRRQDGRAKYTSVYARTYATAKAKLEERKRMVVSPPGRELPPDGSGAFCVVFGTG